MIGLGAYIGDYSGAKYEFTPYTGKYEDIEILGKGSQYTDDSVLTTAVMDWLTGSNETPISNYLRAYGRTYRYAGYGKMFNDWLDQDDAPAYGSFGNGSGMRVSPVGFWANTLEECLDLAKETAIVTHDHPEGIKGAQAIATAIYLAKRGKSKEEIKNFVERLFKYDLDRSVDSIKGTHKFDATCQVTVPEALICFFESKNFEDCVRKSIWIGGDVDTIGAMACPIAEAYYGIPYSIQYTMKSKLDENMINRLSKFNYELSYRG